MIKKYCTTRNIDGDLYAETICAGSWVEAQLFCARAGVELDGEFKFSMPNFPGAKHVANFIIFWKNHIKKET